MSYVPPSTPNVDFDLDYEWPRARHNELAFNLGGEQPSIYPPAPGLTLRVAGRWQDGGAQDSRTGLVHENGTRTDQGLQARFAAAPPRENAEQLPWGDAPIKNAEPTTIGWARPAPTDANDQLPWGDSPDKTAPPLQLPWGKPPARTSRRSICRLSARRLPISARTAAGARPRCTSARTAPASSTCARPRTACIST